MGAVPAAGACLGWSGYGLRATAVGPVPQAGKLLYSHYAASFTTPA